MAFDAAWLRQVFDRQLPLAGYAVREEQQAMAGYVQTALAKGRHLLAEGGVGTGKTFAYLIPLLAFLKERQAPILIATHTIALQEQLVERDIPAVARLLSLPAPTLLAKGREHYLCKGRLAEFRTKHPEQGALIDWGQRTMTGDRAQAPAVPEAVWEQVNWSEGGPCTRMCRQAATCPSQAARKRWQQAEGIIVTNHHQLCADLVARASGRSVLALPGALVIDEAHAFADAARQLLGTRLRLKGLGAMQQAAMAQAGGRGPVGTGWLAAGKSLDQLLPARVRWQDDDEAQRFAVALDGPLEAELRRVVEGGIALLAHLDGQDARPARIDAAERLARALPALQALLAPDRHVAWIEGDGPARRAVELVTAPRDLAPILKQRLWGRPVPVILTSATLAPAEDFSPIKRELGLEQPLMCAVGSPYDYERQARLYLPTDLPHPGQDPEAFYAAAYDRLEALLEATQGRALVLFTSKRRAAEAHRRLAKFRVLLQDRGDPSVLATFIQEPAAVLLGTAYWTGLDVPGETLSCVVIVKLPFAPPDPLIEARAGGGDVMERVLLPDMLLKLKQGAGRAIRRETDRAVIAVLDPRTQRYEEDVLASLPPAPIAADLAEVARFLAPPG
ncbi:MAG: ATP-dependent helicase DinG [Cyanobacteria bacterium RYN_339]|nr:ATP-dependent helicase DinG [Cyanobacteria bacterium RYN_339]